MHQQFRKIRILSRTAITLLAALPALFLAGCAPVPGNSFLNTPSMLDPKGPIAARISGLSWVFFILGGIIYVGVIAYLLYALYRPKRGRLEDELQHPDRGSGIVAFWGIGFTTVVLLILFGLNITTMAANDLTQHGDSPLEIEVIGWQYWWEVRYPNQGFETANEIHIPVGVPVRLLLSTQDVIHSFWVPELTGKLDMIPNRVHTLTLIADREGSFWGECAEFCGTQHAKMKLLVIAEPQAAFDAWTAAQAQPPPTAEDGLALEGQQIFLGSACVYCHAVQGTNATGNIGPDLTHLASRRTLGAGILENTTGNLAGWILDAQAIKPGNHMPPMNLTGTELDALLAYLATLK